MSDRSPPLVTLVILLAGCASVQEEEAQKAELARVHLNEGIAYNKAGQHAEAVEAFDTAIELHPTYALAFYQRGNAHFYLGQDLEALADYTEAMKLSPGFDRALFNRGETYRRMGRWKDSLKDLQDFHHANPSDANALKRIGSLLHEHVPAKRYEALEFLRRYLNLVGHDEEVERWVAELERDAAGSAPPPPP